MEAEFLAWLKKNLPQGDRSVVPLGDDAAVLAWQARANVVVTSDLLAEGVHFVLAEHSPGQIGRKLIAVNLSDLAAMAAEPVGLVVSVLLPADMPVEAIKRLYTGMLQACGEFSEFDISIDGGDTNVWAGPLALSATAFGHCRNAPLVRSGARPGDALLVTGALGASLSGHHMNFTPRIREAIQLNDQYEIHAAMDISDGLALDAMRMSEASECGVTIALPDVPISVAAEQAAIREPIRTAIDRALSDGEDFELIIAVSAEEAERVLRDEPLDIPIRQIGSFHKERGLWQDDGQGNRTILEPRGYLHSG